MTETNAKCLEVFPNWLRALNQDLQTILKVITNKDVNEDTRKALIGGVNYLFKSLDLIPDGIDDIGYLDDAFILRLSIKQALKQTSNFDNVDDETKQQLEVLNKDTELIEELLGVDLFERLEKYTAHLSAGTARGRTVEDIASKEGVFKEFAAETNDFIKKYSSPGFSKDEKNIIKLTAFLQARLPK